MLHAPEEATSYKAFDSIFPLRLLPTAGGRTLDQFMEGVIPWHKQSSIPEGITPVGNRRQHRGKYWGIQGAKDIRQREEKRGISLLSRVGWVWRGGKLMGAEKEPCKIREHATRGKV